MTNNVASRALRAACWTVLGVSITAAAPELRAQQAQVITFRDAIRIALDRNTSLRIARNSSELDEVTLRQERAQRVPDFRLNTSTAQTYGRTFNQSEGRVENRSTQTVNTGVQSSMVLYDGSISPSIRAARLGADAGDLDVERTRQTVVFTVATNFLGLIQNREQLRVRQESFAAEQALEAQINEYVEAGVRPIADLYQQQAVVASARLAVVDASRAAQLAEVDLMQTLQLDPSGRYEFVAPEFDEAASAQQYQFDSLLVRAIAQRVDLDAEEIRLEAAEQQLRAARAGRRPALSLTAGYNTAYSSATELNFFDQLDQRRGGSVGLGLSLPILDRAGTSIATQRARIAADNARIAVEDRRQEVALQVRRAQLDFQSAQEQLRAAEAQQRAAELALQTVQERYQVGAATLVELTQARAVGVQAASAIVSARYNLLFQRTLMDYYIGVLNPETVR
ncbi:MAG TPA: TolC family protein [Gemmatimonadaceae bacterium]|nr:TolC family protein [Gemmatimonadaceae bacterium]